MNHVYRPPFQVSNQSDKKILPWDFLYVKQNFLQVNGAVDRPFGGAAQDADADVFARFLPLRVHQ